MEELIDALERLQEARAEYKEAAKDVEYDRGYFLWREQKKIDDAKAELNRLFMEAVTLVVREEMEKQKNPLYWD